MSNPALPMPPGLALTRLPRLTPALTGLLLGFAAALIWARTSLWRAPVCRDSLPTKPRPPRRGVLFGARRNPVPHFRQCLFKQSRG
jgi:hypothetical protein